MPPEARTSTSEESRLIVVVLNQDRTAIYHNGLPRAEPFLHQKQIGLRYVMSLADSANRETLSYTFVQTFALRCAHALPEVCPNDSGRYRVNPYWCQLDC